MYKSKQFNVVGQRPPTSHRSQPILKQRSRWISPSLLACIPLTALIVVVWSFAASAQDAEPLTPEDVQGALNMIWVLVASILVIFMNAGFAMLETGFCRQKNAVNILAKNLIVFAIAPLAIGPLDFL